MDEMIFKSFKMQFLNPPINISQQPIRGPFLSARRGVRPERPYLKSIPLMLHPIIIQGQQGQFCVIALTDHCEPTNTSAPA